MTTNATARRPARVDVRIRKILLAGLLLGVIAVVAPLIDMATVDSIGGHVREAYPGWSSANISADRTAIAGYLVAVGALGLVGWGVSLWMARRRGGRIVVTALFVVGTVMALVTLTASGGAYGTIVPALFGVLSILPCIPGLAAVVMLWRFSTGGPERPESGDMAESLEK